MFKINTTPSKLFETPMFVVFQIPVNSWKQKIIDENSTRTLTDGTRKSPTPSWILPFVWSVLHSYGISKEGGSTTLSQWWTLTAGFTKIQHTVPDFSEHMINMNSVFEFELLSRWVPWADSSTVTTTDVSESLTPSVSRLSGGISMSSFFTRNK